MRTLSAAMVTLAILEATFVSGYEDKSIYDAGLEAYKRGHYQVAMYEFEPRAMRGDAFAQFYVGLMYHLGHGVNEDKKMAEKWYEKASEQCEPHAQYNLAILYLGWEDKDVTMIKGTIKGLLKNALKNPQFSKKLVAEAQYQLGKIYEDANGEEAKPDSAQYWYEKAANSEHVEAQHRLGVMYHDGEGVEANHDSARYWYEKAADRMDRDRDIGHVEAQYNLSILYAERDNRDSTQYWLERAANQGLDKAQYQLSGIHSASGNFKKGEEWLIKSANQEFDLARHDLAAIYSNCLKKDELIKNKKISTEDYKKCKQLGDGIRKKWENIIRSFHTLAQQDTNAVFSQYGLGAHFEMGLKNDEGEVVVKQNYEEAYYWYSLADKRKEKAWAELIARRIFLKIARNGYEKDFIKPLGEAVKRVGIHLTKDKKREIDSLVNSWKPKILRASGTGFYINSEYILTNAHVVCSNDISSSQCNKYDELRIPFQRVDSIVAIDKDVDLALLRVGSDAKGDFIAKFRDTNIQLTEKTAMFGYPLSLSTLSFSGNFTEGIVSGLSGPINDPQASNLFQHTAPIQPGNSGGPVLDETGNVIGVVVSNLREFEALPISNDSYDIINVAQNINFAINLNTIKEFLKKEKVPYKTTTSDSPLTSKEIAKRAKMFTVPVLSFKNIQDD